MFFPCACEKNVWDLCSLLRPIHTIVVVFEAKMMPSHFLKSPPTIRPAPNAQHQQTPPSHAALSAHRAKRAATLPTLHGQPTRAQTPWLWISVGAPSVLATATRDNTNPAQQLQNVLPASGQHFRDKQAVAPHDK